jgi:hypothetical protein
MSTPSENANSVPVEMEWKEYLEYRRAPIVVLAGGPMTGKTKFFKYATHGVYSFPTTQIKCSLGKCGILFVDTPGERNYRKKDYSWAGVFNIADMILNFGNWSPSEIEGIEPLYDPIHLTWSGDDEETMSRILRAFNK